MRAALLRLALLAACMAGADKGVQNASKPNLLLLLLGPGPAGAFNGYLSPAHPLYNATGASAATCRLCANRVAQCTRAI